MLHGSVVFESRKFRVERHMLDHGGKSHAYDVVVHPGAAVILPVLGDGRLVLIQNYRLALDEELLELPAGTLEPGEPPAECAARELAEETGYRAGHVEPLVTFYSSPGIMTERLHAFVATELVVGPAALEATEQIRVMLMSHAEVMAAIHSGRLQDGKSIVTLLYYDRFVRGEGGGA